MPSYKFTLSLFVILLICETAPCQQKTMGPMLKDGSFLYDKLYGYVHTIGKSVVERECGRGCFFIKFQVDAKGNIADIMSNNGAWNVLDTLVKSALASTTGQWLVPQTGSGSAKTFLLPVLFSVGYCKSVVDSKASTASELIASMPNIWDSTEITTSWQKDLYYNFMHMNDFASSPKKLPQPVNYTSLECVLLAPFYVMAPKE
jgi:hypothetical protein